MCQGGLRLEIIVGHRGNTGNAQITNERGGLSSPVAGVLGVLRSTFVRILHRTAMVMRWCIIVILALLALASGLAFAANWKLPLAVLQNIGLADGGSLHGVR